MWLNWLPEAAAMTGYPVRISPGWSTRGHGQMIEVRGVLGHHTGSQADGEYPTLNTIINGRSDLPGPLAQLGLGRSGTVYVIAAGECYHAGVGEGWGMASPPYDGNGRLIGIEAESRGLGDWTTEQIDCYPRLVAALILTAEKYKVLVGQASAGRYMGHLNWARPVGRKNDPKPQPDGTLSTIWMRAEVARYLANPQTIKKTSGGDELIMDAEVKAAFAALEKKMDDIYRLVTVGDGPDVPPERDTHANNIKVVKAGLKKVQDRLDALEAKP